MNTSSPLVCTCPGLTARKAHLQRNERSEFCDSGQFLTSHTTAVPVAAQRATALLWVWLITRTLIASEAEPAGLTCCRSWSLSRAGRESRKSGRSTAAAGRTGSLPGAPESGKPTWRRAGCGAPAQTALGKDTGDGTVRQRRGLLPGTGARVVGTDLGLRGSLRRDSRPHL